MFKTSNYICCQRKALRDMRASQYPSKGPLLLIENHWSQCDCYIAITARGVCAYSKLAILSWRKTQQVQPVEHICRDSPETYPLLWHESMMDCKPYATSRLQLHVSDRHRHQIYGQEEWTEQILTNMNWHCLDHPQLFPILVRYHDDTSPRTERHSRHTPQYQYSWVEWRRPEHH